MAKETSNKSTAAIVDGLENFDLTISEAERDVFADHVQIVGGKGGRIQARFRVRWWLRPGVRDRFSSWDVGLTNTAMILIYSPCDLNGDHFLALFTDTADLRDTERDGIAPQGCTAVVEQILKKAYGSASWPPPVNEPWKKLEGTGAEHSDAVDKLLTAARELETHIASLYLPLGGCDLRATEVLDDTRTGKSHSAAEAIKVFNLDVNLIRSMRYRITAEQESHLAIHNEAGHRVSGSRAAALEFARDIENGLLVIVAHDLRLRRAEDEAATAVLAGAITTSIKK
jgi:hypothetical protein